MRTRFVVLTLAALAPSGATAQNPPVTVTVDVAANRHAISPLVYGVHFAPTATMIDHGSRIKSVDPTAQVLGPEEWGWDGFFYSGKDEQNITDGVCNFGDNCPTARVTGAWNTWPTC